MTIVQPSSAADSGARAAAVTVAGADWAPRRAGSRRLARATSPTTITAGFCTPAAAASATAAAERRSRRALVRGVPVLDDGDGAVCGNARLLGGANQAGEGRDAHQHDGRHRLIGERGEGALARLGLPVDDVHGCGGAAMGDGDSRRLRHRDDARETRHDLDGDAGGQTRGDFFATAAVDERVAALEPHDALSRARVRDQEGVDLVLGNGMMIGRLPTSITSTSGSSSLRTSVGSEAIGDDDIGLGEEATPAKGHEVGRAGPAADEVDAPGGSRAATPQGQPPIAQQVADRIAQAGGAARVDAGVGDDADDDVARARLGGEARGTVRAVGRVHAQDAAFLAGRGEEGIRRRGRRSRCGRARRRRHRRRGPGAASIGDVGVDQGANVVVSLGATIRMWAPSASKRSARRAVTGAAADHQHIAPASETPSIVVITLAPSHVDVSVMRGDGPDGRRV